MNTFLKALIVAAALFAGVNSIVVSAQARTSDQTGTSACESNSFTPHGIWDCR